MRTAIFVLSYIWLGHKFGYELIMVALLAQLLLHQYDSEGRGEENESD